MGNTISLERLLSLNVRDIEELFGKEKLPEILQMLRTNSKIIEKDEIEDKLEELDRNREELAKKLTTVKGELKGISIAY